MANDENDRLARRVATLHARGVEESLQIVNDLGNGRYGLDRPDLVGRMAWCGFEGMIFKSDRGSLGGL